MSNIINDTPCGLSNMEKPRGRGRGRGMMHKKDTPIKEDLSAAPVSNTSNSNGDNKDHSTDQSPNKPRETKVRRTRAGFEPYQVKKKVAATPPRDNETTKAKLSSSTTQEKNSNHKSRSSSSRKPKPHKKYSNEKPGFHGSRNQQGQRQSLIAKTEGNHSPQREDWDLEASPQNNSNNDSNCANPTVSMEEKDEKESSTCNGVSIKNDDKIILNNNKLQKKEDIKRKTQGISLLECPCTCNMSGDRIDSCIGECRSREASPNLTSSITTLNLNDSIDNKFLVASPVEAQEEVPEHSVLDSDAENEEDGNASLQNMSNNEVITQRDNNISIKENKKKSNDPSDSGSNNSLVGSEPYDFRVGLIDCLQNEIDRPSSKSSLSRTSSSGESSLSRKFSAGSDSLFTVMKPFKETIKNIDTGKRVNKTESNFDNAKLNQITISETNHNVKPRSQMNNIMSILNENKSKSTVDAQRDKIRDRRKLKNQDEKRKDKSPAEKRDSRHRHSKQLKNSPKKNKADSENSNHNETSSKGGLIVLPKSEYIDEYDRSTNYSTSPKHVHFSADASQEKPSADKKQIINQYLTEIKDKHYQLKKLLARGFQSLESINVMLRASEMIQQKYGELIITYQDYAFRYDYESSLWKNAFHNIISCFREFLENKTVAPSTLQEIGKQYWNFLQNGVQFLDSLTLQLQEEGRFDLDDYLNDPVKMASCAKQIKFALRSCHLLLIFIGDLERYIAQLQQENNFEKAQVCYKQAQILAPKNGKSYNQLAVVAVMTKHKLDAVYYYTRSLQASNPILTAKDRLTSIFQEIKKKAAVYRQKHNTIADPVIASNSVGPSFATSNTNNFERNTKKKNADHLRDEIWIFYRNNHMFKVMLTDCNEIINLTPSSQLSKQQQRNEDLEVIIHDKLTLKKVNHGFIVHFLFLHCKLYTNIGLEEFTSVHEETLSDLTTLLAYPKASSVKLKNLLKYMAINIFMIHNLIEKQEHNEVIAGTALDYAIVFGMDMFAVICKHCSNLLTADSINHNLVVQFLPAVRIWLRWLSQHSSIVAKSSVSSMLDLWASVCELLNVIESAEVNDPVPSDNENVKNVYLLEDLDLAGFKPLTSVLTYRSLSKEEEEIGCYHLRICDMKKLINKIDEHGQLPFALDESENVYKPVQSTVVSSSPSKLPKLLEDEDEVEVSEDVVIEDEEEDYGDVSHVDQLKTLKATLTKQIQDQESQRQTALAVLGSHKSQGRHLSENSPSYLVADTNCYIDHLQYILQLLDSKDFTLIVPLIVLTELDGLKVGSYYDEKKFQEKQRNVQECARLSVDALEDRFSRQDSNIRAITSSGTEMSTIAFRAEELSSDRGTNDDVILSCCLKYCEEQIIRTEDDTSVVRRNVVLLTNDRNLRVKAHTRFVPTVDIATFMKMAKFVS